jgi:phenylpropionate dioxygenase-like ring-hydroxylating dioxygenase large terminal subunit
MIQPAEEAAATRASPREREQVAVDQNGRDGNSLPRSWYLLCRSRDVRPGQVISRSLGDKPVVIFRGDTGSVHVLAAHCAHMGAHLGRGTVVGDCVRCPLHHWEWDGGGACRSHFGSRGDDTDEVRQESYPVHEAFGAVFAFNGPEALFDPPGFTDDDRDLRTLVGPPVTLACPWEALVANGFDMQHFETVHGRALREPPVIDSTDPWRTQLRYVSRVTGTGPADRAMKWLSGDRIAVQVTCFGGTNITVHSHAGRTQSQLMLGVLPIGPDRTTITPIFAVRRNRWGPLQAAQLMVSRWLFSSFLRKDVSVMEQMRWRPRVDGMPASRSLEHMLQFMASLPRSD